MRYRCGSLQAMCCEDRYRPRVRLNVERGHPAPQPESSAGTYFDDQSPSEAGLVASHHAESKR